MAAFVNYCHRNTRSAKGSVLIYLRPDKVRHVLEDDPDSFWALFTAVLNTIVHDHKLCGYMVGVHDEELMNVCDTLAQLALHWIAAHEIAHVATHHLRSDLIDERIFNDFPMQWRFEFEADYSAAGLLVAYAEANKIDMSYVLQALSFLFLSLELIERGKLLWNNGKGDPKDANSVLRGDASSPTHPAPFMRYASLVRLLPGIIGRNESEEGRAELASSIQAYFNDTITVGSWLCQH
jgi:hypothetical protein